MARLVDGIIPTATWCVVTGLAVGSLAQDTLRPPQLGVPPSAAGSAAAYTYPSTGAGPAVYPSPSTPSTTSRYPTTEMSAPRMDGARPAAPGGPPPAGPGQQAFPPYSRPPMAGPPQATFPPGFPAGPPAGYAPPAGYGPPPTAQPPVAQRPAGPNPSQLFEPARLIARVGNEPILAGDLLPQVNQVLEPYREQATEEQLAEQQEKLLRQLLGQAIEYKLLYQDFLRSIPADKRTEILSNAEAKLFEEYDEKELAKLLKSAKVSTPAELDAKLRQYGSSLDRKKRDFMEQQLARAQLSRNVEFNPEVTHDDMLRYYHEHEDDFAITPAARWEQMTVKFDNFPSKAAAYRALAEMGNEVLRGAPFAAVARRNSQDVQAQDGGLYDWTEKGSLVSASLDRAIFVLPVGKLSQIIEDNRGFHIVRVIERREAGRVPFTEAQVDIKETLRKERVQAQVRQYLEKLKKSIRVWNAFEEAETASNASALGY